MARVDREWLRVAGLVVAGWAAACGPAAVEVGAGDAAVRVEALEEGAACRSERMGAAIVDLAGVDRYILWNGKVVTMDERRPVARALLVEGNRIAAVGSNREILAMADPATPVLDLRGRTVLPGFVDPHTHLFDAAADQGLTFDETQRLALESGITAVSDMFGRPAITQQLLAYANAGHLRLRLELYLPYNSTCGTPFEAFWYERFAPKSTMAPRMRMGGVKFFVEPSVCADQWVRPVFSEALLDSFTAQGLAAWGANGLAVPRANLEALVKRAHDLGYQVAIHAIGDVGIETSLDTLEAVLRDSGDSANERRHAILHNTFLRDDLLPRYARTGILAVVEPATRCGAEVMLGYVGWENGSFYKRWHDLLRTGAKVAFDSDWPFYPIDPMGQLSALVTGRAGSCPPTWDLQTVRVRDGLKGMTTAAAYAMGREEEIGSLAVGKLADLVVLSANPLEVTPERIAEIRALVTVVDGKVEFARDSDGDGVPDLEDRCPASDLGEWVVVEGCETGVPNRLVGQGCSIADRIAECRALARHHGSFVRCVGHLAAELKKAGEIDGKEHGAIQRCAGRASAP